MTTLRSPFQRRYPPELHERAVRTALAARPREVSATVHVECRGFDGGPRRSGNKPVNQG
jgi:hypothetical protein